jgi:Flavin containing amine oxidoreductase
MILYGCVVEHIERGENRLRIDCRHEGMLDRVEAEAVICTIPFSALRHIAVTPEWTAEKRKVIDGLRYGPDVPTCLILWWAKDPSDSAKIKYFSFLGLNAYFVKSRGVRIIQAALRRSPRLGSANGRFVSQLESQVGFGSSTR